MFCFAKLFDVSVRQINNRIIKLKNLFNDYACLCLFFSECNFEMTFKINKHHNLVKNKNVQKSQ